MSVFSDPTKEQVDTSELLDRLFVGLALAIQVGVVSVQYVYVVRIDVDCISSHYMFTLIFD